MTYKVIVALEAIEDMQSPSGLVLPITVNTTPTMATTEVEAPVAIVGVV